MNKRLRKKLHKGEFRQYGFEFSFGFGPPLGTEEFPFSSKPGMCFPIFFKR